MREDSQDYEQGPGGEQKVYSKEPCTPDYETMIKRQNEKRDDLRRSREALETIYKEHDLSSPITSKILHCVGVLRAQELRSEKEVDNLIKLHDGK